MYIITVEEEQKQGVIDLVSHISFPYYISKSTLAASSSLFFEEPCLFSTGSSLLTLTATDADQGGTPNSTFDYKIKSVSPNPSDIEFYIDGSGRISFEGCLDFEVNNVT